MKWSSKIYVHPLTLCTFLVGLLSGYFKYLVIIFAIIITHELGHVVMSKKFKRKIKRINILPFGGMVEIDSELSTDIFEDLLIAIAGIFFQLILGITVQFLYARGAIDFQYYEFIASYNATIILFNLVPIAPLDGYKIVKYASEIFLPYKKTFVISCILSFILLGTFAILNVHLILDNVFIFAFLVFSTIVELKTYRFTFNRFLLERSLHGVNYSRKDISKVEDMYKNRTNFIDGVHERKFLRDLFTYKRT